MSQRRQLISLTRSVSRHWAASTRAASTSAQAWTRPIAEGVNPAYDAALELLDGHSQKLHQRAEALRSQTGQTDAETAELRRRAKKLEVEARIIDPRLRSTFTNLQEIGQDVEEGEADALRTLAERKWRKEGKLDRLVRGSPQASVSCQRITEILSHGSTQQSILQSALVNHQQLPAVNQGLSYYHLRFVDAAQMIVPSSTPLTPTVPKDRSNFILRDWLSENGFGNPADAVKGIHMFREGGKGFGRDFREIANEHKNEVEAVRKIYTEVLGTF
ncbi:hypothetical protein QFC22_003936 [Naganishia vaughanmartiniae]|uniref:Uncharacterized protein n=1 Tax=Naganishia vaughanmartiniae TaxID=1424756 RepID=A0ACC2X553_9TREE|nr:hypothetical protein QFC22_003936 [Naganishia vaughanmartiniae]